MKAAYDLSKLKSRRNPYASKLKKSVTIIVWMVATAMLSGCTDNSSDERLRKVLCLQAGANISEAVVTKRVRGIVPIGTPEPEIAKMAAAIGVGKDSLSSYHFISNRGMAVVRIEYDPSTFGVVKSHWKISFHLDSSKKLSSVTAKRYLTGL